MKNIVLTTLNAALDEIISWRDDYARQLDEAEKMATYRIRQTEISTGFLSRNPVTRLGEWVIEKRNAAGEWERITSGDTEIEAKRNFICWLKAEIEDAETPESEYAD